jgi:hypothetical protein
MGLLPKVARQPHRSRLGAPRTPREDQDQVRKAENLEKDRTRHDNCHKPLLAAVAANMLWRR